MINCLIESKPALVATFALAYSHNNTEMLIGTARDVGLHMNKNSTFFPVLFFLAATLLPVLAKPATAEVIFKQTFEYFSVTGKTTKEIFQDFQRKSPIRPQGEYEAALGVAAIKLTPEIRYQTSQNTCSVFDVRVKSDVVIHLPQWTNYKQADHYSRMGWDVLFKRIKAHELVHAAIARDYAGRLDEKLRHQRPRKNCDKLERRLMKAAQKIQNQHDRAQRQFDHDEKRAQTHFKP